MVQKQSQAKLLEKENPNNATAVSPTLNRVTRPVPSRRMRKALQRLDKMVPIETIIDRVPARETGIAREVEIEGQAAPNSESGSPRLINET